MSDEQCIRLEAFTSCWLFLSTSLLLISIRATAVLVNEMLQVVAERCLGESSKFWPYLQSLPKGISGLPIFFRPDEVAALQYPPLIQQINLRCRWLLKFSSEELSQQARHFNNISPDANILGLLFVLHALRIGQSSREM